MPIGEWRPFDSGQTPAMGCPLSLEFDPGNLLLHSGYSAGGADQAAGVVVQLRAGEDDGRVGLLRTLRIHRVDKGFAAQAKRIELLTMQGVALYKIEGAGELG